ATGRAACYEAREYQDIVLATARDVGAGGRVVRPARLELATFGFVVRRSIQLSYGRTSRGTRSLAQAPPGQKRVGFADCASTPSRGERASRVRHARPGAFGPHDAAPKAIPGPSPNTKRSPMRIPAAIQAALRSMTTGDAGAVAPGAFAFTAKYQARSEVPPNDDAAAEIKTSRAPRGLKRPAITSVVPPAR